MLDVSMFLHPTSLRRLRTIAGSRNPEALRGLAVSDAFVRFLEFGRNNPRVVVTLLSKHFNVAPRLIDIGAIRELLGSPLFRDRVLKYKRREFEEIPPAYHALLELTGNEWMTQIIFEEWEYLTTNSWLLSKTRAVYDHMIDAGANALYVTKAKLERAVKSTKQALDDATGRIKDLTDRAVRRTIKKTTPGPITPNDRVYAVAKWVAVGGGAASSLMVPVAGVAMTAVTGLFLLYDP